MKVVFGPTALIGIVSGQRSRNDVPRLHILEFYLGQILKPNNNKKNKKKKKEFNFALLGTLVLNISQLYYGIFA